MQEKIAPVQRLLQLGLGRLSFGVDRAFNDLQFREPRVLHLGHGWR